jgi:16S rRNA (uracil1498-N3)-methyltransferase
MALPFFYHDRVGDTKDLTLDEVTSRHIVQVLRMEKGEEINITDGRGSIYRAAIADAHKKHCTVEVHDKTYTVPPAGKISIAISLLKNAARFEWFLEKATELGVSEIIPLLCERTEKEKFRQERLQQIVISAMLQSQQCWLPVLHQPIPFKLLLRQEEIVTADNKLIAHCLPEDRRPLIKVAGAMDDSQIILIGPEGDFTAEEIDFALQNNFQAVVLGDTRLRTETAGMVAATILKLAASGA